MPPSSLRSNGGSSPCSFASQIARGSGPGSAAFDLRSTGWPADSRSAPKGWSRRPVSPKGLEIGVGMSGSTTPDGSGGQGRGGDDDEEVARAFHGTIRSGGAAGQRGRTTPTPGNNRLPRCHRRSCSGQQDPNQCRCGKIKGDASRGHGDEGPSWLEQHGSRRPAWNGRSKGRRRHW